MHSSNLILWGQIKFCPTEENGISKYVWTTSWTCLVSDEELQSNQTSETKSHDVQNVYVIWICKYKRKVKVKVPT